MTVITDQYRREQIAKALADYKERKETKTLTLEYRNQQRTFEVIRIDPNLLLLNHNNSRLTAQLHDHPESEIVYEDSRSEKAQSILSNLLAKTERYKTLKDELSQLTQQNPGLISRSGLLINGNTRVVALRELGVTGVDVALLPEDADESAFLDLEMSLQMRRLTHQDYTFTNQLLLMKKYRDFGHSDKDLAIKMGWFRGGQKKVSQHFQLLALIDEVRRLSSTPISYEVFDSKSQHLKDLSEEYEYLKTSDVKAANKMKWARVAAMFLGVNKDQTRAVHEDFIEDDLLSKIESNSSATEMINGLKKVEIDDGLNDLLGQNEGDFESIDHRLFAKKVIVDLIDSDGHLSEDLTPELEEVKKGFRLGAEAIINKNKRNSYLATPSDILQETRETIESVVGMFGEVANQQGFNAGKFEYQLTKLHKAVEDLLKEFKKIKK